MSATILRGPQLRYLVEGQNLGNFFFECFNKYSNRICQIDGTNNKSETFHNVKERTVRLATKLQRTGIKHQDVIFMCAENHLDNIIPMISVTSIGAIIAHLDPSLSVRNVKSLISLLEPKIIFVDDTAVELIEKSLSESGSKCEVVVFGVSEKYTTFSEFIKPQSSQVDFVPLKVNSDDLACILFSSGTSGPPKAVCHTHRTILGIAGQVCHAGWGNGTLHFSSFYWITATLIFLACFHFGNYRVFARNPSDEDIFRMIQNYKVKSMFMAPILTYKLTRFDNRNQYDISSLEVLSFGGTPIAESQILKLRTLLPKCRTNSIYGMTETGVLASFDLETDEEIAKIKYSSCGPPAPMVQIKVVDSKTQLLLGPKEKGEICVKSPFLMKYYYKIDNTNICDNDGFFKTGDEGYYDEDGCIYIVDRIKEMFKYKSWHIIPSAIEEVLLENPFVTDAVVFGVPHEVDGDIPAACIVVKDGCSITEKEIDVFLSQRVADRERLRGGLTIVKSLPRTPTGKVMRRKVRELVLNSKI